MPAVTTATRARLDRRDRDIVEMISQGATYKFVAEKFGVNPVTVLRAVKKYPVSELPKVEQKMVPLIDEKDLLASGLAAAQTKIARYYISLAMNLNETDSNRLVLSDQIKQLVSLHPIVKQDLKQINPQQVNFFINKSETSVDDIERKMSEYASGNAKKMNEEK